MVSLGPDHSTTSAERAEAYLAFAARARSRADQMVRATEALLDRVAIARRLSEEASENMRRIRKPTAPSDR